MNLATSEKEKIVKICKRNNKHAIFAQKRQTSNGEKLLTRETESFTVTRRLIWKLFGTSHKTICLN